MSVTGEDSAEPDEQAPPPESATRAMRPAQVVPASDESIATLAEAKEICLRVPRFDGSIVELENAEVWPQTRFYRPDPASPRVYHDGGVFRADGRPCIEAVNAFSGMIHFPEKPELGVAPERLAGKWLFGGYVRSHFGAFLVYCLGRFWAVEDIDMQDVDGVIIIHNDGNLSPEIGKLRAAAERIAGIDYIRDMIGLLSGGKKLHVVSDPLVVERLVVPTAITGSMVLNGQPNFLRMCGGLHRWADDRAREKAAALPPPPRGLRALFGRLLGRRPPPGPARRIYVSRSRAQINQAQFLLETVLEENLRSNGYVIQHPQELPISERLVAYREAQDIIIAEGSAAHLLAMAVRPEHRIAVVQRRAGSRRFSEQLRAFGVREAHPVEAIAGRVVPADESVRDSPRVNVAAPAVLDFARLRDELAKLGLIDPAKWRVPERAEVEAAVEAYAEARRRAPGRRFFEHVYIIDDLKNG